MEEYKDCERCHWRLPINFPGKYCLKCEEELLFADVRDYIRSNEVNEYMVAEKFNIPLRKVRGWIKDGRIEYVELGTRIVGTVCNRCGKPISFGSLCSKCMRLVNNNDKKILYIADPKEDARMRFLDDEE